jgi:hypothetical protein
MSGRQVVTFLAVVALAGCGASLQSASVPSAGAMARPGQGSVGGSWMLPDKKKGTTLVYSSDWLTEDVNVYEYPKGELVGQVAGFSYPYGGCVDAIGDV